jgi:hypothetical protein
MGASIAFEPGDLPAPGPATIATQSRADSNHPELGATHKRTSSESAAQAAPTPAASMIETSHPVARACTSASRPSTAGTSSTQSGGAAIGRRMSTGAGPGSWASLAGSRRSRYFAAAVRT